MFFMLCVLHGIAGSDRGSHQQNEEAGINSFGDNSDEGYDTLQRMSCERGIVSTVSNKWKYHSPK